MDKETLKQAASDPRYITGIYNYCDRWCERCPFTSHCLNYALSGEQTTGPENSDLSNEAFWENLRESFQVTMDLVQEFAEEQGIDLDDLDLDEAREEHRLYNEVAGKNPCCTGALKYRDSVDDWFRSMGALFEQEDQETDYDTGAFPAPFFESDEALQDAIEVIRWYQNQIYVKLMRAVRGKMTETEPDPLEDFQKDSAGSAKVALIGMDRSIAAWGTIRQMLPVDAETILNMIIFLEKLRKRVEKEFPDARAFIRPGFDKIDLNS